VPVARNNPTHIGRTKKEWSWHGCEGLIPAGHEAVLVNYVADNHFYKTLHYHVRCGQGIRELDAELDAMFRRHTDEYLDVMRRIKDLAGLPASSDITEP